MLCFVAIQIPRHIECTHAPGLLFAMIVIRIFVKSHTIPKTTDMDTNDSHTAHDHDQSVRYLSCTCYLRISADTIG